MLLTTCCAPPDDVTHVNDEPSVDAVTWLHTESPRDTVTLLVRPAPATVTVVPPTSDPKVGDIEETENVKVSVSLQRGR